MSKQPGLNLVYSNFKSSECSITEHEMLLPGLSDHCTMTSQLKTFVDEDMGESFVNLM